MATIIIADEADRQCTGVTPLKTRAVHSMHEPSGFRRQARRYLRLAKLLSQV